MRGHRDLILYLVVNIKKPPQKWDTLTELQKFSVVPITSKQQKYKFHLSVYST